MVTRMEPYMIRRGWTVEGKWNRIEYQGEELQQAEGGTVTRYMSKKSLTEFQIIPPPVCKVKLSIAPTECHRLTHAKR